MHEHLSCSLRLPRRLLRQTRLFPVVALLVGGLGFAVHAQAPGPAGAAAPLLVRNITLIDGTGAAPRPGMDILVREGRIAAVGPTGSLAAADAGVIVEGRGLVAIPGLIDAHVHLSGGRRADQEDQLRRTLHGGVMAVWDLAGDCRNTADLARAALAGEIASPAIYYAAVMAGPPFFSDPRIVAASLGFTPGEAPWARAIAPDTDIVRAVSEAKGTGASTIKIYAALDAPTARRLALEAKRQGMRVVAHATVFPARPGDLVDAGVDMLAHAAYLAWEGSAPSPEYKKRAQGDFAGVPADGPAIEHVLREMQKKGVALNPTLWVLSDERSKDPVAARRTAWMSEVTRRAKALGVPIVAGTDDMILPDAEMPGLHTELEWLVTHGGLTPMEALTAATSAAARAMGVDALRGTIAAGRTADLVLLEASPADDIRNTRRIGWVIQGGAIVRQPSPRKLP